MRSIILLLLAVISMSIFAMLPPKYLSVKNFKDCLATKNVGTATFWCLPKTKPVSCPEESWQQLSGFAGKEKIPECDD